MQGETECAQTSPGAQRLPGEFEDGPPFGVTSVRSPTLVRPFAVRVLGRGDKRLARPG